MKSRNRTLPFGRYKNSNAKDFYNIWVANSLLTLHAHIKCIHLFDIMNHTAGFAARPDYNRLGKE